MRTDLEMGKGKMCAQAGHCVMQLMRDIGFREQSEIDALEMWMSEGGVKIVLKVKDIEEIVRVAELGGSLGLIGGAIRDLGLTQIPENSMTCAWIFGKTEDVDKVTEGLKLL